MRTNFKTEQRLGYRVVLFFLLLVSMNMPCAATFGQNKQTIVVQSLDKMAVAVTKNYFKNKGMKCSRCGSAEEIIHFLAKYYGDTYRRQDLYGAVYGLWESRNEYKPSDSISAFLEKNFKKHVVRQLDARDAPAKLVAPIIAAAAKQAGEGIQVENSTNKPASETILNGVKKPDEKPADKPAENAVSTKKTEPKREKKGEKKQSAVAKEKPVEPAEVYPETLSVEDSLRKVVAARNDSIQKLTFKEQNFKTQSETDAEDKFISRVLYAFFAMLGAILLWLIRYFVDDRKKQKTAATLPPSLPPPGFKTTTSNQGTSLSTGFSNQAQTTSASSVATKPVGSHVNSNPPVVVQAQPTAPATHPNTQIASTEIITTIENLIKQNKTKQAIEVFDEYLLKMQQSET